MSSTGSTWYGLVQSPRDAYIILEASRLGVLARMTRRLTDLERAEVIRPGAVFVWEEKEAGIKRWTDHVRWSPSRVSGAFLIYSEISSDVPDPLSAQSPNDMLLKQSFSSTTTHGEKLHLIAYYSKAALENGILPSVQQDPRLARIHVPAGVYPDHRATNDQEWAGPSDAKANLLVRPSASATRAPQRAPVQADSRPPRKTWQDPGPPDWEARGYTPATQHPRATHPQAGFPPLPSASVLSEGGNDAADPYRGQRHDASTIPQGGNPYSPSPYDHRQPSVHPSSAMPPGSYAPAPLPAGAYAGDYGARGYPQVGRPGGGPGPPDELARHSPLQYDLAYGNQGGFGSPRPGGAPPHSSRPSPTSGHALPSIQYPYNGDLQQQQQSPYMQGQVSPQVGYYPQQQPFNAARHWPAHGYVSAAPLAPFAPGQPPPHSQNFYDRPPSQVPRKRSASPLDSQRANPSPPGSRPLSVPTDDESRPTLPPINQSSTNSASKQPPLRLPPISMTPPTGGGSNPGSFAGSPIAGPPPQLHPSARHSPAPLQGHTSNAISVSGESSNQQDALPMLAEAAAANGHARASTPSRTPRSPHSPNGVTGSASTSSGQRGTGTLPSTPDRAGKGSPERASKRRRISEAAEEEKGTGSEPGSDDEGRGSSGERSRSRSRESGGSGGYESGSKSCRGSEDRRQLDRLQGGLKL